MLSVSERRLRLDMDITVTRAVDCRRAWTLTDLLGRPLGRIAQARGSTDLSISVDRGQDEKGPPLRAAQV
jgi:hypothetical protein